MSTSYKLISSYEDRRAAESFLNENKIEFDDLKFPSVVARRGREVIGVIGTTPTDSGIVAGPIHVKVNGNQAFVLKSLITSYENVLKRTGVTMYNFCTDEDTGWAKIWSRTPEICTKISEEESGRVWFRRKL